MTMRSTGLLLLAVMTALPAAADDSLAPAGRPARCNNQFALDLYGRLAEQKGNLVFSPYSITSALAMTYAGARGATATEMAAVLRFPSDGSMDVHASQQSLRSALESAATSKDVRLAVANSLWGQEGEPFLPAFLDLVKKFYGAGFFELDFAKDPEAARKRINAWVEERTEDRIQELLKPRHITRVTSMVLANALYLKAPWRKPFPRPRTEELPFHPLEGPATKVPTMHVLTKLGYAEGNGVKALELPYKGRQLSMVILLPDDFPAFEKGLSEEGLRELVDEISDEGVKVWLPRFKIRRPFSLADHLTAMGMKSAFGPGADFSGMRRHGGLSISAVVHEAFVDVNEEGTEAAAATAVVMKRGGPRPPSRWVEFRADRPFLFLIRHVPTGCVLFLGRVSDPPGS
jgi:serpin B